MGTHVVRIILQDATVDLQTTLGEIVMTIHTPEEQGDRLMVWVQPVQELEQG